MVDITSRQIIDIIETRETEAVKAWLSTFTSLRYVSRDGSPTYKKAITQANKNIIQISDRFHLLKGLTDAARKYINGNFKKKIGLSVSYSGNNGTKSDIPWLRDIKYSELKTDRNVSAMERKINLIEGIKNLQQEGNSPKKIAERVGLTVETVKKYLKYDFNLASHNILPYIRDIKSLVLKRIVFKEIEHIIRQKGFSGTTSAIRKVTIQERKLRKISKKRNVKTVKRQVLVSLLYKPIDKVKEISQEQLNKIVCANPMVGKLFEIVKLFKEILLGKNARKLDCWVKRAKRLGIREINCFINGILRDIDAVKNAIKYDFNNGIAEGKVNKLKVIKRIMYGRCSFFLLKNKVLYLEIKR